MADEKAVLDFAAQTTGVRLVPGELIPDVVWEALPRALAVYNTLSAHGDPVKIAEGLGELIEAARPLMKWVDEVAGDCVNNAQALEERKIAERFRNALAAIGVE